MLPEKKINNLRNFFSVRKKFDSFFSLFDFFYGNDWIAIP